MHKEMPVIQVNRVVDPKRIIKKWMAAGDGRHMGSLTQNKTKNIGSGACTVFDTLSIFSRRPSVRGSFAVRAAHLPEGAVRHVRGQVASGHVAMQGRSRHRHPLPGKGPEAGPQNGIFKLSTVIGKMAFSQIT
jgi:hypothetical protein